MMTLKHDAISVLDYLDAAGTQNVRAIAAWLGKRTNTPNLLADMRYHGLIQCEDDCYGDRWQITEKGKVARLMGAV